MFYYYKNTFLNYNKKKLFFYSNNCINSKIEITQKENSYKNFPKIRFNQQAPFKIQKNFTLDWHLRPNKNLHKISKNKKFLKLASFYSQLNANEVSKKFTYLMIFHSNIQIEKVQAKKENSKFLEYSDSNTSFDQPFLSSKIHRFPNFPELEKKKKVFAHLQSKNYSEFSKIFLPIYNRTFWWILLPTQSIVTHLRWNLFLKRITNFLEFIKLSNSQIKDGRKLTSTVFFDLFPEFLIEKPIHWYWMLPFFGCIGLMKMGNNDPINYVNSYFFNNSYFTNNFQTQLDFNSSSTFSKNFIQKNIPLEMFEFLNYKNYLFNCSFKYINNFFLNCNNHNGIQIKKTWLSKQKEYYICNYKDDFVQKELKNNVNELTKLSIIFWWKKNWEEITNQRNFIKSDLIHSKSSSSCDEKKYFINNIFFNTNSKFYSVDSFFYSTFYWYWHYLDTKNINDFLTLNYRKLLLKQERMAHQEEHYGSKILSNNNSGLTNIVSNNIIKTRVVLPVKNHSEVNNFFYDNHNGPINIFPLKIEFPWYNSNFTKNEIEQQRPNKIINTSIMETLDSHFQNKTMKIYLNSNTYANNDREVERIINSSISQPKRGLQNSSQRNKFNLLVKHILIKNKNSFLLKEIGFPFHLKNNLPYSFFLFCVSSKDQLKLISNENKMLKNYLDLKKEKTSQYFSRVCKNNNKKRSPLVLKNKQNLVFTLYNSIGSEILASNLNPVFRLINSSSQNNNVSEKTMYHFQNTLKTDSHEFLQCLKKNNQLLMKNFKQTYQKNLSISSFHQAAFLLNNFLSKCSFELGMSRITTSNFVKYFDEISNTKKVEINNFKFIDFSNHNGYSILNDENKIQIHKKPLLMSGQIFININSISKEKNKKLSNLINDISTNDEMKFYLPNPLNSFSNTNKFACLVNSKQFKDSKFRAVSNNLLDLNFGGTEFSPIQKQNLSLKQHRHYILNSKELEHFFIANLLKHFHNLRSQNIKLKKNTKKIQFNEPLWFQIKKNYQYKIIRPRFNFQANISKVKKNKNIINISNKNDNSNLLLIDFSDYMKKREMSLRNSIFSIQPEKNILPFLFLPKNSLSIIKNKKNKFCNSFNNIPNFRYVSNQSLFWNFINSNYSFGLLDTIQPFIFEKFSNLLQKSRISLLNRNNENIKNNYFFSNFLLKKYQRKNKNWLGPGPQGFFYKRINKLNFQSIQKQSGKNIQEARTRTDYAEITKILKTQSKKLKKVSDVQPIGELLWEVRAKHKIPEILLLQQTLFFQKKLVRKSSEENNLFNQSSSDKSRLSQKSQTVLRKMTNRRHFRKHIVLETLFDWTRDSISLRKMLRKIKFKNDWQIFFKFILKSNKTLKNSVNSPRLDYYSNWYKKNLYNDNHNGVKNALISNNLNLKLKTNLKISNIRPFFYQLSQTQQIKKFFLSKKKISLFFQDFDNYKNSLIQSTLTNVYSKATATWKPLQLLNFKNNQPCFSKQLQKNVFGNDSNHNGSNCYNILIFPESNLFYYFSFQSIINPILYKNNKNKLNYSEALHQSINKSSLIFTTKASLDFLTSFSHIRKNQVKSNNHITNQPNDYNNNFNRTIMVINQQNLTKSGLPLYNIKKKWNPKEFTINKKSLNQTLIHYNLNDNNHKGSFNNNLLKNNYKFNQLANQLNTSFFVNFPRNIYLNISQYYNIDNFESFKKFFQCNKKQENSTNPIQSFRKKQENHTLLFYSNPLSIRSSLFLNKLYFTNIFWHSNDFILKSTSTIFNKNELIKNGIPQNWGFQIRNMNYQKNIEAQFTLNFQKVLATLSTWQYKFQIRRDFILQIFYIYLDHLGAFLNDVCNKLIYDNLFNQIDNWIFFKQTEFGMQNHNGITPLSFNTSLKFKKDLIIQPSWSFDLLNHIKIQYPYLYNKIQQNNQNNIQKIQLKTIKSPDIGENLLLKTPEFDSQKQLVVSPSFKTQLLLIDSLRIYSGKKPGSCKTYNMFSNVSNNFKNIPFTDPSIINNISSQSSLIPTSTLFCQKWIQKKQFFNVSKLNFLKKQKKLRQILNLFDEKKQNYTIVNNQDNQAFLFLSYDRHLKQLNFFNKNQISKNFQRRSGFLFNRSLTTQNFNSFSSISKVTRGSISFYVYTTFESSLSNFIFFTQILLVHVCLIFCLISVYQSAFQFSLKNCVSIFVILIHYFLNSRYRLKRLVRYIYQSTAQPLLTNINEYFHSSHSMHYKFFVFLNNLSKLIFYKKFFGWGTIYKTSFPSFIDFLFKNPFKKTQFFLIKEKYNKNKNNLFVNADHNGFYNRKKTDFSTGYKIDFKGDLMEQPLSLSKPNNEKKVNTRMSLLRNVNIIKKIYLDKTQNSLDSFNPTSDSVFSRKNNIPPSFFWEQEYPTQSDLLKILQKKEQLRKIKNQNSSTFQLKFKLLKWNLALILFIGDSEIFSELEPYREMHWYFLKRLPILLRSNTDSEDPINMYDYQADEKLRKFKEQFKKATEIFQKRQNIIERKTQRNIKKDSAITTHKVSKDKEKFIKNTDQLYFELINKKYPSQEKNLLTTLENKQTIILFIKSDKQLTQQFIPVSDNTYINKLFNLLNNFSFFRKKVSRGQPFWKPLFSFLAHTLFISRFAKLHRRFRDSLFIIHFNWIPFGPFMAIISTFLWKNYILNFSNFFNNKNKVFFNNTNKNSNSSLLMSMRFFYKLYFKENKQIKNYNPLKFSDILEAQNHLKMKNNFNHNGQSYSSPFKIIGVSDTKINTFEYKKFYEEIRQIWDNIYNENSSFSEFAPPVFNRGFLWNFVKFEKKYERVIVKWLNNQKNDNNHSGTIKYNFIQSSIDTNLLLNLKTSEKSTNIYQSLFINNQEESVQDRYIHYKTYDPKVRLYRFYTNFSKNLKDIGIIREANNIHPIFGSLLCEIYSGLFSIQAERKNNIFQKQNSHSQYSFLPFSSAKNILLIGNTNATNFVLLIQAFAAETGLKLFMEDAKRLRRLGRRGINKSIKRLEKLFEIAQSHSPSIILLEDIDVIGSKRRVIKINEEEDDDDMAIRSFFSKLIYRKQHNYKSVNQSFVNQSLFSNNQEVYRNMQKSILPESPIPRNLIKYQLTRRRAFSNYFSNQTNSSYTTFITKFNVFKNLSSIDGNFSNNIASSPTNAVIIWKLLKSKLVTPKKTIKEAPWKHIPVDSMRSIPLITYSIRVKVAKLTMLAIYTMNTQLRLVKDLIKLLEKMQYESYKGFIVFATTNKLATLDPSLRRPGRFDETVFLPSLTVNPAFKHVGKLHFLNVLSIDSESFLNFSHTFNIINASNFTINWNINSLYSNVVLQDNSQKLFSPNSISIRDLINSLADNVYNQNIFMQNQNNVYLNNISYDILGNLGFQKQNFSISSKSVVLLSLAYSKAGQLIIQLFLNNLGNDNHNGMKFPQSKKISNNLALTSENNEFTLWSNAALFSPFKKMQVSYTSKQNQIKTWLIYYFAGKIGEFCFFSFSNKIGKNFVDNNTLNYYQQSKFNYFFDKNTLALRSLSSIQPNWKNINSSIFSLMRTSCIYSKTHFTAKLFNLVDIFKKRQRNFSENLGPSLLYEYFNLNTEYFLRKNNISLEEQLQKQQVQKYLLNLQKKPLRKFIFNSTAINVTKKHSYFNKISNVKILDKTKNQEVQGENDVRLALFRILFNELGSLDLIALRPTAMNYYYDKKIVSKHRFRKYTYKWWNWHLKRTTDSLEEFQYLDFFPYSDKQYNPRRQRWMLTNGYFAYWLSQETILYYQIYEQLIIECFQKSYLQLDRHREILDYLVQLLMTKQVLTEIEWILFFKRFF